MPRFYRLSTAMTLAGLAALFTMTGCGNGKVIGSGPLPTSPPITPNVSFEYSVPTAAASPVTIATGVDGFLYFTEFAASKIGQLTTGGSFVEVVTKTAAASPTGIIVGPDGHIWYTEAATHDIATFTTFNAASMTEYTVPWAGSMPRLITRGSPFNSMYFTDPGANAIGEITAGGTFSGPFAIPTAGAQPTGIVTGPDGREWFTEQTAGKIGILNTTTNVISEIAISTNSQPTAIVAGPDNALWFTENIAGGAKLGRLTTTGLYTEYPLTGSGSALGLAMDLFGNMVVADGTNNAIGVFNISTHSFTEYPVKTASAQPTWVTLGPDGKMYFTEFAADKIGQFSYF